MVTQALWDKDSPLLQLPYFTQELVEECKANEVDDIVDLMNLDDNKRDEILKMTTEQIEKIAGVCNAYPSVSLNFNKTQEGTTGEVMNIEVELEREGECAEVHSPYFPGNREEQWWVIIGQPKTNRLFGIKKVKILQQQTVRISFIAPDIGNHECMMYLLCDSYLGADQGEKVTLTIYA